MKTYLEKLDLAYSEGSTHDYEKKILHYLWKLFKIELPPYKFLPLVYNLFIIYFIVFISVSTIVIVALFVYALLESYYDAVTLYQLVENRFSHTVAFGTLIWLIILALTKNKYSWCTYSMKYWKISAEPCINMRTKFILIAFSASVVLMGIIIFEERFIRFAITMISVIVIYNTVEDLMLFNEVKDWKKVPLSDIKFQIKEDEEISNIGKIKLYSLEVFYKYVLNGKEYFSSQVYFDELSHEALFKNRKEIHIKQWILDNKDIVKNTYVNLSNFSESVLYRDIKRSSYIGKIIVLLGAFLLIIIINNFINLGYYFGR